jgi:hypothetical protein
MPAPGYAPGVTTPRSGEAKPDRCPDGPCADELLQNKLKYQGRVETEPEKPIPHHTLIGIMQKSMAAARLARLLTGVRAADQREAVERLRLPFPLASDADLLLGRALRLPTFEIEVSDQHDGGGRKRLLQRLTFVVRHGLIEKVFYPVFPPDGHAAQVLAWIQRVPGDITP